MPSPVEIALPQLEIILYTFYLLIQQTIKFNCKFPQLAQLEHKNFNETNVHLSQISKNTEHCVDVNRISNLHSVLRTDHLNLEEKSLLLTI